MDEAAFELLIEKLEELGGRNTWPADWILCMDMDALRDVPKRQRRKWLKKAKEESVRRSIQERVDHIADAVANNDELSVRIWIAAFPSDLAGLFPNLTEAECNAWINQAIAASKPLPSRIS